MQSSSLRGRTLALVAGVLLLATTAAHAQTPIPPASPTPSSTAMPVPSATSSVLLPSGKTLLVRSGKTILSRGSAHLDATFQGEGPQIGTSTGTGSGDVQFRRKRVHLVSTTTTKVTVQGEPLTFTDRDETIQVGKRSAERINKKAWSCSNIITNSIGFDPAHITSPYKTLKTLGPSDVNGVPTWQVSGILRQQGQGLEETDVFDVAQKSYLLLRLTASLDLSVTAPPTTITVVETFSKYGQKVPIVLPKACKKK